LHENASEKTITPPSVQFDTKLAWKFAIVKLKLPINFNAISKNVKILQIRPVEPKL